MKSKIGLKSILTILLIFNVVFTFGQLNQISEKQKTNFNWAFRVGVGYQFTNYIESGTSLWYINDKKYGNAVLLYSTLECNPNLNGNHHKPIWGLKIGAEAYNNIFAYGFELKQLTDFDNNSLVLTPKLGIGALGIIGLFFGFNIYDKANYFPSIGKFQVGLNANINKKCIAEILREKK
ncbi:MAG: hypothetical protein QM530_01680 [Phycisphaerales bacterium]|nr:hypothetical protein [Phycisphaerales bacterium]